MAIHDASQDFKKIFEEFLKSFDETTERMRKSQEEATARYLQSLDGRFELFSKTLEERQESETEEVDSSTYQPVEQFVQEIDKITTEHTILDQGESLHHVQELGLAQGESPILHDSMLGSNNNGLEKELANGNAELILDGHGDVNGKVDQLVEKLAQGEFLFVYQPLNMDAYFDNVWTTLKVARMLEHVKSVDAHKVFDDTPMKSILFSCYFFLIFDPGICHEDYVDSHCAEVPDLGAQGIHDRNGIVQKLEEREVKIEGELLEYYGLKEQESGITELQGQLKIKTVEIDMLKITINSLQAERKNLHEEIVHGASTKKELEIKSFSMKRGS